MTAQLFGLWRRAAVVGLMLGNLLLASPLPAAAAGDVRIGICQSTAQGPATFSTALWKGAELALADVNAHGGIGGHPLRPVPVDVGNNDPAQARLSLNKAIDLDKITSLVCWGTNVMVQNGPLIDDADILAFTTSSGTKVVKASKLTQQLEAVTSLYCKVAAAEIKRQYPAVKTFAVLYVNYEFGIELRDKCEEEFGKKGIRLVASEGHPNAPPDLRSQLTKLIDAKPDAIYLAPIGGGTVALGIRTARELGYKGLLTTYGAGDTPDIYTLKLAEDNFFYVSHATPPGAPEAVKTATEQYGGYTLMGYEYVWLVARLGNEVLKNGQKLSGNALVAQLRKDRDIQTPVNRYVFQDDGYTIRPLAIFTIEHGARKLQHVLSASDLE
jgi:ABC-type branched-subunit amino acid transport system substrate-binding protein